MLLTKPITALLQQSLSAPLTTLMLTTPSGQILASASTLPSTILRSRATLAIGIWGLYTQNKGMIGDALPLGSDVRRDKGEGKGDAGGVQTITVQLTLGILTIRVLSCGLLVLGLSDPPPPPPTITQSTENATHDGAPSAGALLDQSSPPHSGHTTSQAGSLRIKGGNVARDAERQGQGQALLPSSPPGGIGAVEDIRSYAPSECGSTSTVSGKGREVQAVRRRTCEVAAVLDGELRGFRVGEMI